MFGFGGPSPSRTRAKLFFGAGVVLGSCVLVYSHDSRAGIHRWLVIPVLHALTANDPEQSHVVAIKVLASPFAPVDNGWDDEEVLGFDLWGRHFSNPIGLAAGFDKHAEAIDGLLGLGFGYVEVGSVTPDAQLGNPKPRFFRLPETQSVINRYGFNSDGHTVVLSRLRNRVVEFVRSHVLLLPAGLYAAPSPAEITPLDPVDRLLSSPSGRDAAVVDAIGLPRSLILGRVLGINLGKNKASIPDSIDDYTDGVRRLGPYADVLVVNVSSPNTPGLRQLQKRGMLEELLKEVVRMRDALKGDFRPAVVVKISPDMSPEEIQDVAEAALDTRIDGVIVANTTVSRPASAGSWALAPLQWVLHHVTKRTAPTLAEVGGLSGPSVKPLALKTLATLYTATDGKLPLVGCGGVTTAQDALDYARAGASFVQLYTSFGYQGPGLPRDLKDGVAAALRTQSKRWTDLIGVDAERLAPPRPTKRDSETEALRHELESVLADLAEGRPVFIPGQNTSLAVRAAAGLSDEPTAMLDQNSSLGVDAVAASATLKSTLPTATQDRDLPESGVLDVASAPVPLQPAVVPIIIMEHGGVPPPRSESLKPLTDPEPVLPGLLDATGRVAGELAQKDAPATAQVVAATSDKLQEVVKGERPKAAPEGSPIARLFSSFGERKNAGTEGKRAV